MWYEANCQPTCLHILQTSTEGVHPPALDTPPAPSALWRRAQGPGRPKENRTDTAKPRKPGDFRNQCPREHRRTASGGRIFHPSRLTHPKHPATLKFNERCRRLGFSLKMALKNCPVYAHSEVPAWRRGAMGGSPNQE